METVGRFPTYRLRRSTQLVAKEQIGRDGGIRTHDPLTPSQVRYQAALHPVSGAGAPAFGLAGLGGRCAAFRRGRAGRRARRPSSTSSRSVPTGGVAAVASARAASSRACREHVENRPQPVADERNPRARVGAERVEHLRDSASRASRAALAVGGDDSSSRRRAPASVSPSPNTSCLIRSTWSTSDCRYSRGVSGDFCTPIPGNSFSHDRSTYGWSCASSQTSAALNSFGVIRASIAADHAIRAGSSRSPRDVRPHAWRLGRATRASFAPAAPDLEPDRRALEAERLAQPVHQEPLVGKVESRSPRW